MRSAILLGLLAFTMSAREIYRSPQFTVSSDRVTQGSLEARAVSATRIESNYTGSPKSWTLSRDTQAFPQLRSPHVLIDALYNLSLEELIKDVRPDGTFMAGEKWDGVWTRDISYSILLSLAAIDPETSKNSLMRKVARGRIIQDTGTGGSWPCSTDRMTWALAAWEVYLATVDRDWLARSFEIIRASADDDAHVIFDPETGLALGESSFLDWREQTYPRWMQPADIYSSQALGTNAVHYRTYRILAQMARLLGKPAAQYDSVADRIRDAVNKYLWVEPRGYYGQYRYGRGFMSLSPRSEALGEALAILFDIAPEDRRRKVLENVPVMPFGIPCIYPQIPDIPPYHNNAIWPFVQAFWNLANARQGNEPALLHGFGAIWRAAALFLTNQENIVADTGSAEGTQINSPRQLWSVAGNLAMIYRVLFGIDFTPEGLRFHPVIPKPLSGTYELTGFRYRGATLDIRVEGDGQRIASIAMDGSPLHSDRLPAGLTGKHAIHISLGGDRLPSARINRVDSEVAPETPSAFWGALSVGGTSNLSWKPVAGATAFKVLRNGSSVQTTETNTVNIAPQIRNAEFQVLAVRGERNQSFLSEPLPYLPDPPLLIDTSGELGQQFTLQINVPKTGEYWLDFRYANGSGPINTDNKCAIRTLYVDGNSLGAVVFPQRGTDNWDAFGWSSRRRIRLTAGQHALKLALDPWDRNMNGEINRAVVAQLRLTPVE